MNYIDITFIALLALSLLFGLCGKASKRIRKMLVWIIAILVSYFTFDKVRDLLYTITVGDMTIKQSLDAVIVNLFNSNETLAGVYNKIAPMLNSIYNFILFWVEIIACLIVGNIIIGIIFGIGALVRKAKLKKPVKAVKTLGIPGLISGFFTWVFIILPLLFLTPVIKNADNVLELLPDGTIPATVMPVIDTVVDQINSSKIVDHSKYIFTFTGNRVVEYKVGDEVKNVYNDLASIGSLTKAAGLVSAIMPADGDDVSPTAMIGALKEMSEEDLTEVLGALEENKDLITAIVPAETFTSIGIDIEEINFKDEAPALAVVLDIVEVSDNGDMSFNLENVDNTKLTNALVSSELLGAVIQPGMLSVLPDANKTAITSAIDAKLTAGDIDQAKYNQLMSYFNAPAN